MCVCDPHIAASNVALDLAAPTLFRFSSGCVARPPGAPCWGANTAFLYVFFVFCCVFFCIPTCSKAPRSVPCQNVQSACHGGKWGFCRLLRHDNDTVFVCLPTQQPMLLVGGISSTMDGEILTPPSKWQVEPPPCFWSVRKIQAPGTTQSYLNFTRQKLWKPPLVILAIFGRLLATFVLKLRSCISVCHGHLGRFVTFFHTIFRILLS